ncbi:type VI secretion system accessory protein TagJ [Xanthomonas citri]|uniref:type VI secretion system accessory protein TagJ n=1 Tax=Xanthomonas citri TaxID=346 RepID=UPI000247CB49|nr:type VI secretion system accessory protein TagJ [Xanthomonas citri]MBE0316668.1 virulence protein SciE type [Xanthomonas citri pv. punicae]MDS0759277.1 virulence protein SciE type [Xanthomonas citri pv. punicae]MDS0763055.1 virulence protein SciE type [Xanthomonas citri pv. punicae]MDS0797823.1 virulence protein SciE type [Xanthomonas citri pv. punicae]MDS0830462.1 virulence protein SciE type [Xanthomonas citri pv. punicae]
MDATAQTLLAQGEPAQALQQLIQQVRRQPADAAQRVFLFQLLAVLGQWSRAADQLRACGELDATTQPLVHTYLAVLQGEQTRAEVFAGKRLPRVMGEPAEWLAMHLQALQLAAQGHGEQAAALRAQAFERAPASAGVLDGERFQWLADADTRFGPCIELMLDSGYAWAPLSQIQQLRMQAPLDLRDTVWAPVSVLWRNGGQAFGYLPVRYPGSEHLDAGELQLARRTGWTHVAQGEIGLGQRMWSTESREVALLDVRDVRFDAG